MQPLSAEALAKEDISVEMKLRVFLEQAKLFEKIYEEANRLKKVIVVRPYAEEKTS